MDRDAIGEGTIAESIASRLRHCSVVTPCEASLQKTIQELFIAHAIPHEREYALSPSERVDFYVCEESLAIEVKVKGSTSQVIRQLQRYALCPEVHSIMLVTTRLRHRAVPTHINRKPIHVVCLMPF